MGFTFLNVHSFKRFGGEISMRLRNSDDFILSLHPKDVTIHPLFMQRTLNISEGVSTRTFNRVIVSIFLLN